MFPLQILKNFSKSKNTIRLLIRNYSFSLATIYMPISTIIHYNYLFWTSSRHTILYYHNIMLSYQSTIHYSISCHFSILLFKLSISLLKSVLAGTFCVLPNKNPNISFANFIKLLTLYVSISSES